MARRGFYSFCFDDDQWRASKVRQMGVIEGDRALGDNDWEKLRNQGDDAVKRWIDKQMVGKSVVVLIGARTAGRKFVQYEISRGWDNGMGVFGIYVHNLLDRDLKQSALNLPGFCGDPVIGLRPIVAGRVQRSRRLRTRLAGCRRSGGECGGC